MPSNDRVVAVQWTLPYFTNIPTDVITNTWHFIYELVPDPTPTEFSLLAAALRAFYDGVYGISFRASHTVGTAARVAMYDLQQPTPRVPVYEAGSVVAGTPQAASAPTELAICASFKGDSVPGVPPARSRGRVYLGGFASPLTAGTTSSFPTLGATARNNICDNMEALKANLAIINWMWVVYSPTQNAQGGQETFEVTSGWVDDTPDTQRRRGVQSVARSVWP